MMGATTLRSPETVSALTEMGWSARMVTSPETLFTLADPPSRVRERSPDTVAYAWTPSRPSTFTSAETPAKLSSACSGMSALMS